MEIHSHGPWTIMQNNDLTISFSLFFSLYKSFTAECRVFNLVFACSMFWLCTVSVFISKEFVPFSLEQVAKYFGFFFSQCKGIFLSFSYFFSSSLLHLSFVSFLLVLFFHLVFFHMHNNGVRMCVYTCRLAFNSMVWKSETGLRKQRCSLTFCSVFFEFRQRLYCCLFYFPFHSSSLHPPDTSPQIISGTLLFSLQLLHKQKREKHKNNQIAHSSHGVYSYLSIHYTIN